MVSFYAPMLGSFLISMAPFALVALALAAVGWGLLRAFSGSWRVVGRGWWSDMSRARREHVAMQRDKQRVAAFRERVSRVERDRGQLFQRVCHSV